MVKDKIRKPVAANISFGRQVEFLQRKCKSEEMSLENSWQAQKIALTATREFIVETLDADDVIDELIQAKMLGRNAAQRVQLMGMSRIDKNRIIVDQLSTGGPGTLEKFCKILKDRRQMFLAEQLEKR